MPHPQAEERPAVRPQGQPQGATCWAAEPGPASRPAPLTPVNANLRKIVSSYSPHTAHNQASRAVTNRHDGMDKTLLSATGQHGPAWRSTAWGSTQSVSGSCPTVLIQRAIQL